MAQAGETLLHRWFEETRKNQKRTDTIDELLTEDTIAPGPVGPDGDGEAVRGRAVFKPFDRHFCTAFPDIHITIDELQRDSDKLIARCPVTGTHRGSNPLVAATNAINITSICIAREENGKIAEALNNFGFLELYQQRGMQLH